MPRVGRADNDANSASARVLRGRSAYSPRGEARLGRVAQNSKVSVTAFRKPQPPTWCGVDEEGPRPTAWGGACPALAAKTTTPSSPARTCCVGVRLVLHGAKRARVARHGMRKLQLRRKNRSSQPGAVSVKKSLSAWCGVERGLRWPQRQRRQLLQYARAPWAAHRFSTGQSARLPRGTEFRSFGYLVAPRAQEASEAKRAPQRTGGWLSENGHVRHRGGQYRALLVASFWIC